MDQSDPKNIESLENQLVQYRQNNQDFSRNDLQILKIYMLFTDTLLKYMHLLTSQKMELIKQMIFQFGIPAYLEVKHFFQDKKFISILRPKAITSGVNQEEQKSEETESQVSIYTTPQFTKKEQQEIAQHVYETIEFVIHKWQSIIQNYNDFEDWKILQDIYHPLLQNYDNHLVQPQTVRIHALTDSQFDNYYNKVILRKKEIDFNCIQQGKFLDGYQNYQELKDELLTNMSDDTLNMFEKQTLQQLITQIEEIMTNLVSCSNDVVENLKTQDLNRSNLKRQKSILKKQSSMLKESSSSLGQMNKINSPLKKKEQQVSTNEILKDIDKTTQNITTDTTHIEEKDDKSSSDEIFDADDALQESVCCRTFFYIDEQVYEEEGYHIEYKNYSFPIQQYKDSSLDPVYVLKKTICGFLNQDGGSILLGINDDQVVKGLFLSNKDQDRFKQYVRNDLVTKVFHPKIQKEVEVEFIPIKRKRNNQWIQGMWVPKIRVLQGKHRDQLYTFVDTQNKNILKSFLRHDAMVEELHIMDQKEIIYERAQNPVDKYPIHRCQKPDQDGVKACKAFDGYNKKQQQKDHQQKSQNFDLSPKNKDRNYQEQQYPELTNKKHNRKGSDHFVDELDYSPFNQPKNKKSPEKKQEKRNPLSITKKNNLEGLELTISIIDLEHSHQKTIKKWLKRQFDFKKNSGNEVLISYGQILVKFKDTDNMQKYQNKFIKDIFPSLEQKMIGKFRKVMCINSIIFPNDSQYKTSIFITNFDQSHRDHLATVIEEILIRKGHKENYEFRITPSNSQFQIACVDKIFQDVYKELIEQQDRIQDDGKGQDIICITKSYKNIQFIGKFVGNFDKLFDCLKVILTYCQFTLKKNSKKQINITFDNIFDAVHSFLILNQEIETIKDFFDKKSLSFNPFVLR